MTMTLYPASRRASASCQTRRSSGTGRFSTIIRIAGLAAGLGLREFILNGERVLLGQESDDALGFAVGQIDSSSDPVGSFEMKQRHLVLLAPEKCSEALWVPDGRIFQLRTIMRGPPGEII